MIDAAFIEQLVAEGRGYRVIARNINFRFRDEWEDVMQQALLTLWMKRHQMRGTNPLTFFRGVVRNVARSYRRLERDAYAVEVEPWHRSTAESRDEEIRQACERLWQLLEQVPEKHRAVFWAWCRRGYRSETHAEQIQLTRLIAALRQAAGVTGKRSRQRFCVAQ